MTVSDASLSGYACGSRSCLPESVANLGRVREIIRFKPAMPHCLNDPTSETDPKVNFDQLDPFVDFETVRPMSTPNVPDPYVVDPSFEEVPTEFMEQSLWVINFAARMYDPETIGVLEGRGIVGSHRHKLRNPITLRDAALALVGQHGSGAWPGQGEDMLL